MKRFFVLIIFWSFIGSNNSQEKGKIPLNDEKISPWYELDVNSEKINTERFTFHPSISEV